MKKVFKITFTATVAFLDGAEIEVDGDMLAEIKGLFQPGEMLACGAGVSDVFGKQLADHVRDADNQAIKTLNN